MMTISVLPAEGKWGVYVEDAGRGAFLLGTSKHSFAADSAAERLAVGHNPETLFENPTDPDVLAACERYYVAATNTVLNIENDMGTGVEVRHFPEDRARHMVAMAAEKKKKK